MRIKKRSQAETKKLQAKYSEKEYRKISKRKALIYKLDKEFDPGSG